MDDSPADAADDPPRGRAVGAPGSLSPALARTLRRTAHYPLWGVVGVTAVAVALGPRIEGPIRYLPLAASLVVLGLPHGAVDHLVPDRLANRDLTRRSLLAVVALYAVLGTAVLVAWALAPAVTFAGFVALTWAHWGQGEVYAVLAVSRGRYPATVRDRVLLATVRGAYPMVLPLVAFPRVYDEVAATVVGLFGPATGLPGWLVAADVRGRIAAGLAALTVAQLALGRWGISDGGDDAARRGWRIDVVEVSLLWAFFLLVPPLLAVGLYFALWHAGRHVARLAVLSDGARGALTRGAVRPALRAFARDAAPLTAVSLALLAGLAAVLGVPRGPSAALAVYLVFIAAVTLPHVVVVAWMDRAQRVWAAAG
ncbi:MAG: Brp/Blh family beta-carotene 15,15'-dioxygenase [Halobacteriaceae archaeon]